MILLGRSAVFDPGDRKSRFCLRGVHLLGSGSDSGSDPNMKMWMLLKRCALFEIRCWFRFSKKWILLGRCAVSGSGSDSGSGPTI